ncbi:MAG: TonB-dependent receptor [Pseudomonadota bacterium]
MRKLDGMARKPMLALAVASALGVTASGGALAQDEPFIEEIIVTASKRETTLQEVPIAVSVTDAETVEKAVILDVLDLQTVVPSLRVTQLQSSANTNFLIRGFGNGANNPGIEPSVGVFIDGVYRSRSASALSDLPNLERVEVLRGPQSTLFGKNASAGVISVVTQAPQFEWDGSAEVLVGNYGATVVRGDVTGPMSDSVAFSLSGSYNTRDGYFDQLATNTGASSDINGRDRYGVRGQLLIQPNDNVSLRFIADYDKIDENCCGTVNLFDGPTGGVVRLIGGNLVPNDAESYETFLNFDSSNEIENSGVSLQADFAFDGFDITSITAFRNQTTVADADSDFTSADLIGRNFEDRDIDTFSQELRLTTSFGDRADMLIGMYYFKEDVKYDTELLYGTDFRAYATGLAVGVGAAPTVFNDLETGLALPLGTFFANGTGVIESATQDDEAISVFANFDVYLGDRTTLTLGANYTQNDKEVTVEQTNTDVFSGLPLAAINPALAGLTAFQFLPPFVDFPNSVEDGTSDDSETTYTVRLSYDFSDNISGYASYATGFKSTSWNLSRDSSFFAADQTALAAAGLLQPNRQPGTRFAGPEETNVVELGLKGQFSRGSFAFALFDQAIEGFQSNTFTGTGFNLTNAGEQSTVGAELETLWYATDSLQLSWAITWLDPEYDEFLFSVVGDLSGTTPPGIHSISSSLAATYNWEFNNGWGMYLRGDYLYEDDVQVVDNVSAELASREVNVLNASIGLQSPTGWSFSLWGRNLTDDSFLLSAFPTVAQSGSANGYPSQPLTYGLSIRKDFN